MNCTIIIITYNRPQHLQRLLGYYNEYGGELNIIVADSSADDIKWVNYNTVASLNNPLFKYSYNFDSSVNPITKIYCALGQVNTKYCVICADDDFISVAGISESTKFLDCNPDFATVCGSYAIFMVNSKGVPYYRLYEGESNICPDSQSRLYSVVANNNGNFYAVRRTGLMYILFAEARKITDDLVITGALKVNPSAFFVEYIVTWLSVIYGKTKCLDTLFCVREGDAPSKFKRVGVSLPEIMKDSNYNNKEREFLECISAYLDINSSIGIIESVKFVRECIEITKKQHLPFTVILSSVISSLHLPIWLDRCIRQVYRSIAGLALPFLYFPFSYIPKHQIELNGINQSLLSNSKEIYQ